MHIPHENIVLSKSKRTSLFHTYLWHAPSAVFPPRSASPRRPVLYGRCTGFRSMELFLSYFNLSSERMVQAETQLIGMTRWSSEVSEEVPATPIQGCIISQSLEWRRSVSGRSSGVLDVKHELNRVANGISPLSEELSNLPQRVRPFKKPIPPINIVSTIMRFSEVSTTPIGALPELRDQRAGKETDGSWAKGSCSRNGDEHSWQGTCPLLD